MLQENSQNETTYLSDNIPAKKIKLTSEQIQKLAKLLSKRLIRIILHKIYLKILN